MNNHSLVVMMGSMWFMPLLSTLKLSEKSLSMGFRMESVADKGWFEFYGGQGLYYLFSQMFFILNSLQLNSIKVFMKMSVVVIIIFMVLII